MQQSRLPELRQLISAKLSELDQTIALRNSVGFDSAREVVLTDRGKSEMNALRSILGEMIALENRHLEERAKNSLHSYRVSVFAGLLSGVLALLAIAAFLFLLRRHLAARNEAARAIAEQGERLRTTLASIGDAVITTDTAGRVTNMNAVAESLTGWAGSDAMGRRLDEVWHIVNEDTRQPVSSPASRALNEGVIVGLANHTLLIAKDGTERPIDDSAAPIRCKEGEIVGCVLVFRDVTERREQERALKEREGRFATLAESIPQLAWMANPDGNVFWMNQRWYDYTGTTLQQMQGDGWHAVHDPAVLPGVVENRARSIATGEPFDMVFPLLGADGSFRSFLTREMPVRGRRGRVTRWVGTATDVTEQREMADRLRQLAAELSEADRVKDEFLSILAHELRNPLAPLRNGLEIMRLSNDSATSLQTRAMMERQLAQMIHLVDDLLDVSRISRGQLELRNERIALDSVLTNAVETSRPLIESNGHELTVSTPPDPLFLDADPTRLAQVFANLLNNAAKFSAPGGRITVTGERAGDYAVVTVEDAGVGIPPEMLPKIFEMFTQVDRTLEKSQSGLGIGLTLVKRLVEMHGGSVEARSAGPHKGSQFTVRLPIAPDQRAPARPDAEHPVRPTGCRVLVADDNADSASSLATLLRIMGNEVWTANDGVEALTVAESVLPDVILMDIGMPRLNGYEACQRLRRQPWGKHVVVVAMTGWGRDHDKRRSEEVGFNSHLVKPVDPADLEKVLAAAAKR